MGKNKKMLVIKNGRVLSSRGELTFGDVLVENGRIRGIGPNLKSELQVDADGNYVLPGLIDLHTHGIGFESTVVGELKEYARLEAPYLAHTGAGLSRDLVPIIGEDQFFIGGGRGGTLKFGIFRRNCREPRN